MSLPETFVADGNHRVSVARANGFIAIDAYVTMIETGVAVNLDPGDTMVTPASEDALMLPGLVATAAPGTVPETITGLLGE